MELVSVTQVSDSGLAAILVDVLEQAGIQAVVGGGLSQSVLPTSAGAPYSVLVADADLDRARDVLSQFDTMPEDDEEE